MMLTLAQQRVQAFSDWLDASSASLRSASGQFVGVGRYASLFPVRTFNEPPSGVGLWHPQSLPLFITADQCDGSRISHPEFAEPSSFQPRAADRLNHLLFMLEDGRAEIPPMAILPLVTPDEPLFRAVERANAVRVSTDAFPVLCAPLWGLEPGERRALFDRLPFLPDPTALTPPPRPAVPKPATKLKVEWAH